MGNVPAKEERSSYRRRASSLAQSTHSLVSTKLKNGGSSSSKKQTRAEREKFKELNAKGLIVKYDENVDGGYLAPYGTYNLNLDYKISVVKEAIIERKIAPFYTPLQEYEKDWDDDTLLKLIDSLSLRALTSQDDDDDEDDDYVNTVDASQLSKKEYRKHLSQKFHRQLKLKSLKWQQYEEDRFKRERLESKQAASKDLKLQLYRNSMECPICFLYYPKWMNYSRCCNQAICSECFVQIKRHDPQFPHDTNETNIEDKRNPDELISEPACCPYCATPNFGVTYTPPRFRTGLGGIAPKSFRNMSSMSDNAIVEDEELTTFELQEEYFRKSSVSTRRGSLPASHPTVVTTDYIRPDWETKLEAARLKLAKRAAAASAIHASNMLIQNRSNDEELEAKMIEEAMRLSILDEQTRQRRESSSRR